MNARRVSAVLAAVAVTVSIAGCGDSEDEEPQYQGVCVDPKTNVRVDDSRCGDGSDSGTSPFLWYWIGTMVGQPNGSYYVPRVGAPVSGGTYTRPTVPAVRGGAPATGGTQKPSDLKSRPVTVYQQPKPAGGASRPAVAPARPAPPAKPVNPAPRRP